MITPSRPSEGLVDALLAFARAWGRTPKAIALPTNIYLRLCLELKAHDPDAARRPVQMPLAVWGTGQLPTDPARGFDVVQAPLFIDFHGPSGVVRITEELP